MDLEEYNITDGERIVGRLCLRRDGLYTLLEARAEAGGDITRLYVCGGGSCTCLGVMLPEGGRVTLRRRLSKLELRALPQPIEGVSIRPPEEKAPPSPAPAAEAAVAEWRPMPDGSLVRLESDGRYIALPAKLRRTVPGIRLTIINGREYLVFRY